MIKRYLIIIVLIVFSLYGKTVRLTNGEWAPYLSEKLAHYGTASKIVTDAFKAVGFDVKYGFFPWKRSFKIAEDNIWDGSLVWSKTPEREETFYYSKKPVLILKDVFFYKTGTVFNYAKFSDLKGKIVGSSLGYSFGDDFTVAAKSGLFKIDKAPTDLLNFKKLLAGRIDVFPCQETVGKELIKTYFLGEQNQFSIAKMPLRVVGYYLILNKKNPKNKRLMEEFDKGFKKIKQHKP